ncbi:transposase, partial [Shigella sonnei]|nr:transposase [Shigella sonnei]
RFADIFQQGNRWLNWLEKQPVQMSRLEHYGGQDEIGLRYNSHRTKREENLVMSGDEFMERFSWHVADKGFRMVIRG